MTFNNVSRLDSKEISTILQSLTKFRQLIWNWVVVNMNKSLEKVNELIYKSSWNIVRRGTNCKVWGFNKSTPNSFLSNEKIF